MDLSIVLPALNENYNVSVMLRAFRRLLTNLDLTYEIIVVDGGSSDGTFEEAVQFGEPVKALRQKSPGYGEALRLGFKEARGDFILTMDCDLSHDPHLVSSLWEKRHQSDLIIASRYIKGGGADMPWLRYVLSRLLNQFVSKFLSLPFNDLSSGYRLYRSSIVKNLKTVSTNFEVLEEILIEAYAEGWRIEEIPMYYRPRKEGKSKARLFAFAVTFLKTLGKMWRLRNSIDCGDYDDRAFDSRIPLQRFWQRRRVQIIRDWAKSKGKTLDVGCGSSRLIGLLENCTFLDILINKLRYARKFKKPLVNGSIWELPFKNRQFDCVVCSQVIEHIPEGDGPFKELKRVLKPGGRMILGTPDYGPINWRVIEKVYGWVAPGGYAHEHITHYTRESLKVLVERLGFKVDDVKYIWNAEMIMLCTLKE